MGLGKLNIKVRKKIEQCTEYRAWLRLCGEKPAGIEWAITEGRLVLEMAVTGENQKLKKHENTVEG